jgi:hypothetical protein
MRVLIVGAGAIGQVFGRHFQLGGADVSFLVRPKYADQARAGFVMYPLNRSASARNTPVRFEGFGVETDQAEALGKGWDLVVLAISSVALRSGTWFQELADNLGDAKLLALQAGPEDPDIVFGAVPQERGAWGMLAIISFQAPLPSQTLPEPGVSYWFPFGGRLAFSGSPEVVDLVTKALSAGGMPTGKVASVQTEVAFSGAILSMVVVALECAGWSFTALRRDPALLGLSVAAMRESWEVATATSGAKTPGALKLIRPFMLKAILAIAPYILPLDLEEFFNFHYVKVAEQTLLMLNTDLARGTASGVARPATAELAARLIRARK